MKRFIGLAVVAAFAAMMMPPVAVGGDKDGKAIFKEYKCSNCHSMESQGIVKKASDDDEDDSKKESPDLSSVGLDRKADWIALFLMKKEAIDGEKHSKKFKGSEDELKVLSAWLEQQKAPKKNKKK